MPWSMPAIVLIIIGAAHAPARSLAEVAFNESIRRLFTPPATVRLNTIDIPPPMPGPPEPPKDSLASAAVKLGEDPAEKDEKAKAEEIGDETSWRLKMTNARVALDQDQLAYEAMQSRINALVADFAARDDPGQRMEIEKQRVRALEELDRLKKQIQKDKDTIGEIEEDARKKGVPPGWIRL